MDFLKKKIIITHLLGSRNLRELKGGNLTSFTGQLTTQGGIPHIDWKDSLIVDKMLSSQNKRR